MIPTHKAAAYFHPGNDDAPSSILTVGKIIIEDASPPLPAHRSKIK